MKEELQNLFPPYRTVEKPNDEGVAFFLHADGFRSIEPSLDGGTVVPFDSNK